MKLIACLWLILFSCLSWAKSEFPIHPALNITPGSLCGHPDKIRYPEKIAYCERNVTTETKYEVIRIYEEHLGFKILENNRANFKIDHFIPLCMGGSNQIDNLWPQHKSIYAVTDPAEFELCQMLSRGRISQKDAIQKIKFIKIRMQ